MPRNRKAPDTDTAPQPAVTPEAMAAARKAFAIAGAEARHASMTPAQRSEAARKAINARWAKVREAAAKGAPSRRASKSTRRG